MDNINLLESLNSMATVDMTDASAVAKLEATAKWKGCETMRDLEDRPHAFSYSISQQSGDNSSHQCCRIHQQDPTKVSGHFGSDPHEGCESDLDLRQHYC